MNKLPASEPTCNVPMETIEDAHQLRAIVTGVVGLLQNPTRHEAVCVVRVAAQRRGTRTDLGQIFDTSPGRAAEVAVAGAVKS